MTVTTGVFTGVNISTITFFLYVNMEIKVIAESFLLLCMLMTQTFSILVKACSWYHAKRIKWNN